METLGTSTGSAINWGEENMFFDNRIVPEYVTTKLASQYLGISENALRIKVCRGEVPAHKFGRQLRFRVAEITNLFERIER